MHTEGPAQAELGWASGQTEVPCETVVYSLISDDGYATSLRVQSGAPLRRRLP